MTNPKPPCLGPTLPQILFSIQAKQPSIPLPHRYLVQGMDIPTPGRRAVQFFTRNMESWETKPELRDHMSLVWGQHHSKFKSYAEAKGKAKKQEKASPKRR